MDTQWMTTVTHALERGAALFTQPVRAESLMPWMHELSISALAAAVVTLGCVMLLELRALARLRRSVDTHLTRVFEQLDLIRFDHVQLLEAQARQAAGLALASSLQKESTSATAAAASTRGTSASSSPALPLGALAAGEARLLASLAEARARRAEDAQAPAAQPLAAMR